MHRPRLICVPDGFFDEKFKLPLLKRKVVVEQVYNCPGFYMYLSNKGGHRPLLRVLLLGCSVPEDGLNAHLHLSSASQRGCLGLLAYKHIPGQPERQHQVIERWLDGRRVQWCLPTGVPGRRGLHSAVPPQVAWETSLEEGRHHSHDREVSYIYIFLSFCAACSRTDTQMGGDLYTLGHN